MSRANRNGGIRVPGKPRRRRRRGRVAQPRTGADGVPRRVNRSQARPARDLRQGKPRRRRRRRREQGSLTDPLSPRQVRREVRADTQQKFRPLEKRVRGDLRASRRRQKEEGGWWQGYLQTVAKGRQEVKQAYDQAGEQMQDFAQQASERDSERSEKLDEQARKSAELRGAEVSTDAAEREAAAQAMRDLSAASEAAGLAERGAITYAYLTDKRRIGRGQAIDSRKQEQRRERSIRQDLRDLGRERGEYAVTKRGELRDKEREYLLKRDVAKLDRRSQRADEIDDRLDNTRADRAEQRLQGAEARQRRENRRKARRAGRDDRRQTTKDRREAWEARRDRRRGDPEDRAGGRNAVSTTQRLIRQSGVPRGDREWADLEEAVAQEAEVSPAEARAAVRRIRSRIQRRRRKQNERPWWQGG